MSNHVLRAKINDSVKVAFVNDRFCGSRKEDGLARLLHLLQDENDYTSKRICILTQ